LTISCVCRRRRRSGRLQVDGAAYRLGFDLLAEPGPDRPLAQIDRIETAPERRSGQAARTALVLMRIRQAANRIETIRKKTAIVWPT